MHFFLQILQGNCSSIEPSVPRRRYYFHDLRFFHGIIQENLALILLAVVHLNKKQIINKVKKKFQGKHSFKAERQRFKVWVMVLI